MWFYVLNGQQQGPFDEAQFEGLIAAGTIFPGTYVWKEGLPNWQPLAQVRSGMGNADACQMCRKSVGADNLIEISGTRVCAECKPLALQSIREGVALGGGGVWSEGRKILTQDGVYFPHRCVKCNEPTTSEPMTRKLYWQSPWLLLLIFVPYVHLLAYIIVSIIMRRKATVYMYLCPTHRQRRIYAIIISWLVLALGFAGIVYGAVSKMTWPILTGLLFIIGAIVVGIMFGRITWTARIDKDKTIRLKGAGKEFLASLPPWTGT